MSKKLFNYIMIVLVLFGVSLILNTDSAEAYAYANITASTPSANNAVITSSAYNWTITFDDRMNISNCTWQTSTDSGSTWVVFNSSVNTSLPGINWSNVHHTDLAENTYTINVSCFLSEDGDFDEFVVEKVLTGIVVDRTAPSAPVIELPKYNNIFATNKIAIKCEGGDSTSGTYSSTVTLTKPSGRQVEVELLGSEEEPWTYEFKDKDTNEAGLYKVDCTVKDLVNFTSVSDQVTFRVFFDDTGGEDTGEEAPIAKLDISTKEQNTGMVNGKQGESKTFTMDGTTAHTVSFIEVGLTSVTFTIESEPVEVTLNVGEYTNVDLDGDGTDDVKVTLSSIDDGLAKVEVINLEKLEEKRKASEPQVPTVTEEPSKMGLWITILVILVIIGVGYYIFNKPKKGKK